MGEVDQLPSGAAAEVSVAAPAVVPDPHLVATLASGVKLKIRLPRMRACNEPKNLATPADGKICAGHLKRYVARDAELLGRYGAGAELYRCERCKTIYLPNPAEEPRSRVLSY